MHSAWPPLAALLLLAPLAGRAVAPPRATPPAPKPAERLVVIDGRSLALPARLVPAQLHAQPQQHGAEPLNLLVSAEERALVSTLVHGGWTPRDPAESAAHPEAAFTLGGRLPDLGFERGGARIDERLRLLLWRRPEKLRGFPLWMGAALKQGGVQPLQAPSTGPHASVEARDRVLAALSFGLAQSREVGPAILGHVRLVWVELADPPPGAEALLGDALPVNRVGIGADGGVHASGAQAGSQAEPRPLLAELPPIHKVTAEVVSRPERAGRKVALTFDACSTLDRSFYDERVIAALQAAKAPATLFISGRWAETHVAQVRALAREPLFEIANHSYIHPHMTEVSPERQREELLWTQQILLSLTGRLPRFFRPPYGELDAEVAQVAAEAGLRTVEYDFPSGDPDKNITKERLIAWVLAKARPGSIVVMHMNRHGWHTAEALPEILAGLRAKEFTLATVGELVDADAAAQ